MKKTLKLLLMQTVLSLFVLSGITVASTENEVRFPELEILNRINAVRDHKLTLNTRLMVSASDHASDMLDREYYDSISPEGETVYQRMQAAGYEASASGEQVAMMVFVNYMSMDRAVDLLFESLTEQASRKLEEASVFDGEFQEIGLEIRESSIHIGERQCNAYILVCDFAAPLLGKSESELMAGQIFNLVNQERKQAGLGLCALVPNVGDENSGIELKYDAFFEGKSLNINSVVNALFQEILENDEAEFLELVNPIWGSMTVSIVSTPAVKDGGMGLNVEMKLRFMEAESTDQAWISGVVFSDANKNGFFDAGEEESDISLQVFGAGIHTRSGVAGEFFIQVAPPVRYRLVLFDRHGTVYCQDFNGKSEFVSMDIGSGIFGSNECD